MRACRCKNTDMSRSCGAGVELHVRLQEDWEGRLRIAGRGKEVVCTCMAQQAQQAQALPSRAGADRTWVINEREASGMPRQSPLAPFCVPVAHVAAPSYGHSGVIKAEGGGGMEAVRVGEPVALPREPPFIVAAPEAINKRVKREADV